MDNQNGTAAATATNELSVIDRSLGTFRAGNEILSLNATRAAMARQIGDQLLADIAANGNALNPELDERCLKFLANCSSAKTEMNDARKPLTQAIDAIKKQFTDCENQLDNKKDGTHAFTVQLYRDRYAEQLAHEERQRQREELQKAAKAQEAIGIRSEAERRLQYNLSEAIVKAQQSITDAFYGMKLLTFDAQALFFSEDHPAFTMQQYENICNIGTIASVHHTSEEIRGITGEVTCDRYQEFEARFSASVNDSHSLYVQHLPERKVALQQQAEADTTERERLKQEEQDQIKAEEDRIKQDQEQRLQQAETNITEQQEAEKVGALFTHQTAIMPHTAAPESRKSVSIEITDAAAWPLIFQTWYEHEGKLLQPADAGKISLNTMIKFCEARAKKYSERIEHPGISYSDKLKAINRKASVA